MEFKIYVILINIQYYFNFVHIYIYDISYFYKCLLGYSSVDNHSNSMHIIIYMSSVILSNWSIHFCIISI